MGTSFRTKSAVLSDMSSRLPATLELAIFALVIAVVGGTILGVIAARNKDRFIDGVVRVFALAGSALPVFWVGLFFLYVFYAPSASLPAPAG